MTLWGELTESWPPPTKDTAMVIALQLTMVVRLIVSKLYSSRLGIIISLLVGIVAATLFWIHPIVDNSLIFVSYFNVNSTKSKDSWSVINEDC